MMVANLRLLSVGDSYMPTGYFEDAFAALQADHDVSYRQIDASRPFEPASASELKLQEYQGAPAELASWMPGVEVLVVHGAPVTDDVLDASEELRLVCCARGGPVNVDVDAVSARGLPLVNTPGKNARGGRRPHARVPRHARARPPGCPALPRRREQAAR